MPVFVSWNRVTGMALAATIGVVGSACSARSRPSATPPDRPTNGETPSDPSVAHLLNRSLHFPVVAPDGACPTTHGKVVTTASFHGTALGHGLVRPILAEQNSALAKNGAAVLHPSDAPPWLAVKVLWFSVPSYEGPFVIRAKRLDRLGPAELGPPPSSKPLVVPAANANAAKGYRTSPGGTYVRTAGCYGWQVDGLTFSEDIVVHLLAA